MWGAFSFSASEDRGRMVCAFSPSPGVSSAAAEGSR
jgi:hypothetical protein